MFFLQPAKTGFVLSLEKFYEKNPKVSMKKAAFFFPLKVKQEKIIDLLNQCINRSVQQSNLQVSSEYYWLLGLT